MADACATPADTQLRALLSAVSGPVVQLDVRGAVTFVNDAFVAATGWAREEVLGATWVGDLVPAGCPTRPLVAAAMCGGVGQGAGELFTRGGERRAMAWDVVPLRDSADVVSGVVCLGRDITGQRHAMRERAQLAGALAATTDRDPVTGLANTLGFVRETAHALRVAARIRRADALLCVRVHGLAAIATSHGVAAAEDAVCAVAEALRGAVRDSDVLARVRADLFAIYAVGTANPDHGDATVVRMRAALDRQNVHARAAGRVFDVDCSVAAAERRPGDAIEPWVARAASLVPPLAPVLTAQTAGPTGRSGRGTRA